MPKTLRGKIESLETTKAGERELAGFNEGERTQLRDAMAGTIAERAGKALTNPKIYGLAGGTAGGGFGGVQQFAAGGFDPVTAGAAAALTSGGMYSAGRALQTGAGRGLGNNIDVLSENLRMRSPLAAGLSRYGYVSDPRTMATDAAAYLAFPQASQAAQRYIDEERVPYRNRR